MLHRIDRQDDRVEVIQGREPATVSVDRGGFPYAQCPDASSAIADGELRCSQLAVLGAPYGARELQGRCGDHRVDESGLPRVAGTGHQHPPVRSSLATPQFAVRQNTGLVLAVATAASVNRPICESSRCCNDGRGYERVLAVVRERAENEASGDERGEAEHRCQAGGAMSRERPHREQHVHCEPAKKGA